MSRLLLTLLPYSKLVKLLLLPKKRNPSRRRKPNSLRKKWRKMQMYTSLALSSQKRKISQSGTLKSSRSQVWSNITIFLDAMFCAHPLSSFGNKSQHSSTRALRKWVSKIAISPCLCQKLPLTRKRATWRASRLKLPGLQRVERATLLSRLQSDQLVRQSCTPVSPSGFNRIEICLWNWTNGLMLFVGNLSTRRLSFVHASSFGKKVTQLMPLVRKL